MSELIASRAAVDDSLAELRRSRAGAVLAPGEPAYESARRCFNALIDRRPAVIVRCLDADDIAAAFAFARTHMLQVAVRGGGHNPAGHCVCDGGLVIDLSLMRRVDVDGSVASLFRRWLRGLRSVLANHSVTPASYFEGGPADLVAKPLPILQPDYDPPPIPTVPRRSLDSNDRQSMVSIALVEQTTRYSSRWLTMLITFPSGRTPRTRGRPHQRQRARSGSGRHDDGGRQGIVSSVLHGPDLRTRITADTREVLFAVYAAAGVGEAAALDHTP